RLVHGGSRRVDCRAPAGAAGLPLQWDEGPGDDQGRRSGGQQHGDRNFNVQRLPVAVRDRRRVPTGGHRRGHRPGEDARTGGPGEGGSLTMVPIGAYVAVSAILFVTGLVGVLVRRNFIIVLMCVEIMLNGANLNLVAFAHHLDSLAGQIMSLFVIAIAAGEAAVGLAIIIVVFRDEIAHRLGWGSVLLSFLCALWVFGQTLGHPEPRTVIAYRWFFGGDLTVNLGFLVDPLTCVMMLVVTGVGFLIHVYSVGYMHGE